MKRKKSSGATTDLRSFLERSVAKKRQSEPEVVSPSPNENQLEMVVFQEPSNNRANTVPSERVRVEQRQPV
jgi:hypothetical protein